MQKATGFSIKTKLVTLISFILLSTIGIVTYNALLLFNKENLNNVYTSTDTITSAKAREINSALKGIVTKGTSIAKSVTPSGKLRLKRLFMDDKSILSLAILTKGKLGQYQEEHRFIHPNNIETLNFPKKEIEEAFSQEIIPYHVISLGEVTATLLKANRIYPIMTLGLPIDNKRIATVHIKTSQFTKLFDKSTTGIYTLYLVNPNGDLVIHPNEELVKSGANLSNIGIVDKMKKSTLEREFTAFIHPQNGQEYYGAYANIETGNLAVVAEVSKSIAFESGQTLIYRSTLVTIMIIFTAFIISYASSKRLVAPLMRLTDATSKITQGNFNVNIDITSKDEIGHLAQSFNDMVVELDNKQKAIERRIEILKEINDSTKTISATLEVEKLLAFYLKTVSKLLEVNSLGVWVVQDDKIKYSSTLNYTDNVDIVKAYQVILQNKSAITNSDDSGNMIRLLIPLTEKEDILGFLYLRDKKDHTYFTNEDLFLAETVSTSLTITLKNIELLLATAEKARMEKELETAKLVQDTLFPPDNVEFDNFKMSSYYTPASECGGDWWGTFYVDEKTVAILMADATGHGVPAALITATAKSSCSTIEYLMHNKPGAISPSPAELLGIINNSVYDSAKGKILMTFFVGILDLETGKLIYSNAGHTNPLIYRQETKPESSKKGNKKHLESLTEGKGLRVGQTLETTYTDATTILNNFDSIMLYTDGITEGENHQKKQYGNGRLQRSYAKHSQKVYSEIRDNIMSDLYKFTEDAPLADDITLLVGRYERK